MEPHDQGLLAAVHVEEEKIRVRSLALLNQDAELGNETRLVENAIKLFIAIGHDYQPASSDDAVLVHFGMRMANSALSALKLALSGYYQQALALTRDVTETGFLLHHLCTTPGAATAWRTASAEDRWKRFSPKAVRKALDAAEGESGRKRAKVYSDASRYGTHVTPEGFGMLVKDDVYMVGPFFHAEYLLLCVRELFMRLCPVVDLLAGSLPELPPVISAFHHALMNEFYVIAVSHGMST